MSQCPHCQTEYSKGQRYCSVCGSFLLHPEEGDNFCPQCGIRVSPRQEFCHECDAPLKGEGLKKVEVASGEAPPVEPARKPTPAPTPKTMPSWIIGALAVGGIIIILLLILIFSRTGPPPAPPAPAPQAEAPAPAVTPPAAPAPAPAAAGEALQEQLQKVLSTLRDAQLKKNLTEFMSVYSATLPNYDQKRKDAQNYWNNYDYANLVFTVDKVQAIDPNNALAWVTWYMDIRNRSNQELSSATQIYQVRFVQELGNWRIQELKEVQ
ncbi:MAG: zinc ribbon domain-containing protein [Deltaproteobacteria bacterium]|nr:zinc ribbon domain-containing protein [Deltaproteobacteria bacterium]